MRIHYLQNDELATPGFIDEWAKVKGFSLTVTRMYQNEVPPPMDEFDFLIILGGRMGAYEEDTYPWLLQEKRFIRSAIDLGKYVLGICLGAQLLANVLGANVYPHTYREIGWWEIEKTVEGSSSILFNGIPSVFTVFEYHQDTFDLPCGALRLASSKACQNQAFSYGDRVLGLQFHPEFTGQMINGFEQKFGSSLSSSEFIQEPKEWCSRTELLDEAKLILFTVLKNFEACIKNHNIKI